MSEQEGPDPRGYECSSFALDTAVGGIDGHGVVEKVMEFETKRAIGGILRDEAVAIACLRAPAPAYDEALVAKVKKSTACLGEIGRGTLNQVFFAGYGNGVSI